MDLKTWLKQSITQWQEVSHSLRTIMANGQKIDPELLKYSLYFNKTGFWLTDYSLIYDDSILKLKPPVVLQCLCLGTQNDIIRMTQEIIETERYLARTKQHNIIYLNHVCYLKNIIDMVMDFKGANRADKRKVLSGDLFKPINCQVIK